MFKICEAPNFFSFFSYLIFKNNIPLALTWLCDFILQKWINDHTLLPSVCTILDLTVAKPADGLRDN